MGSGGFRSCLLSTEAETTIEVLPLATHKHRHYLYAMLACRCVSCVAQGYEYKEFILKFFKVSNITVDKMRDIIGTGIKKQERAVIRKTEDSRTFFFQITMMDDLSVGVFRNIYQTTLRCYPFQR